MRLTQDSVCTLQDATKQAFRSVWTGSPTTNKFSKKIENHFVRSRCIDVLRSQTLKVSSAISGRRDRRLEETSDSLAMLDHWEEAQSDRLLPPSNNYTAL